MSHSFKTLACGAFVGLWGIMLAAAPAHGQARPPSARVEAQNRVKEAREALKLAKEEDTRFKEKYVTELSQKEEWKNTVPNLKKAKAAYEKASKAALASVKASAEYKKLSKERDALVKRSDELRAAKKSTVDPNEVTRVGTEVAKKGIALKKMEAEATEQDPKLLAAKEALDLAEKEMKALDEEIKGLLETDPDYVVVQQTVDQAEADLAAANEAHALAVKTDNEQRRASRPAPQPRPQRSSGSRRNSDAGY